MLEQGACPSLQVGGRGLHPKDPGQPLWGEKGLSEARSQLLRSLWAQTRRGLWISV